MMPLMFHIISVHYQPLLTPLCLRFLSKSLHFHPILSRYQFPEGPVCDWPNGVDCVTVTPKPTNVPTTDPTTITTTEPSTTTPKPTTTTPEGFCLVDNDCSKTPCSSCENQQCYDPECCEVRYFLAPTGAQEVTICVCLSVCPLQVCLEHSIFIFLG